VLKDNPVSEARAVEAAKSAVAAARPLSKNAYKVEIVKSLVKRAILSGSALTDGHSTLRARDS
jgi:xanthine dehydrogenase YagS FAD-binding subunit